MPNLTILAAQIAKPGKSRPARLAYIVSAFPTIEETFVLYEMIEMENLGVPESLSTSIRCGGCV